LLYDVSQTGIPSDNVDEESTKRPHTWDMKSIRRFMIFIGPISSLFDYATFFLMLYFFKCILFTSAGATEASKIFSESLFHTGWFVESLLTQTLIVHIIRTNKIPFIQSRASLLMTLTTLSVMAIGIFLPYSPFASFFGLVPLPLVYWAWIGLFLVSYVVLTHTIKTWLIKKFGVDK
jgi:Mg2+-importing ATPase